MVVFLFLGQSILSLFGVDYQSFVLAGRASSLFPHRWNGLGVELFKHNPSVMSVYRAAGFLSLIGSWHHDHRWFPAAYSPVHGRAGGHRIWCSGSSCSKAAPGLSALGKAGEVCAACSA
jgi:hypothetical protein